MATDWKRERDLRYEVEEDLEGADGLITQGRNEISTLEEQNRTLQKTNTKLVERVRELEAEQTGDRSRVKYLLGKIKRLEQDGKRFWKAIALLEAFDKYATPGKYNGSPFEAEIEAFLIPELNKRYKRQAIDKAMAKGRGGDG